MLAVPRQGVETFPVRLGAVRRYANWDEVADSPVRRRETPTEFLSLGPHWTAHICSRPIGDLAVP